MSAFVSNTVNHRAVIGKLKRFDEGIRRLFEQAIMPQVSSQNLFEGFTGEPLDHREIQTYSEWKVQGCFRNLSRRQRRRSKQRIIYILPIGPFPEAIWKPVEGMETSVFQLIANFVGIFFLGMRVKIMDQILVTELNCKRRIHAVTGKLQLLVSDVLHYLKTCLPSDGYCIIGLTWVDLYPGEDWNFVLGESSCIDGCAVMSFGHFEPQSFVNKQLNESQTNSDHVSSLAKGIESPKAGSQKCSPVAEKGSIVDLTLYLEDFAATDNINEALIWRLLRVISHEICHVFGMSHCAYFTCAMNESKSILEAESQPLFLCPVCLRKLHKAIHFDIVKRYRALCCFLGSLTECDISKRDSTEHLPGTFDRKFDLSVHWLTSMLTFIENKTMCR